VQKRRGLNAPLVAAAVATLVCLGLVGGHGRAWSVPGLDRLERTSIDARFRMRGPRAPLDDRIVIVGIDDDTRKRYPALTQVRRNWAKLIDALAGYRPKLIALDFFFSSKEQILEPALADEVRAAYASAPEGEAKIVLGKVVEELRGDEVLAEAIRKAGNVYLGCVFGLAEGGRAPMEAKEVAGTEKARFGDSVAAGGGNQPNVARYAIATRPEIGAAARGAGTTNILVDEDGETRSTPLVVQHGDRHYLPLGAAIALAAEDRDGDASYVGGQDHATLAGRRVPLGPGAIALLDFLGPGRTFPHVSAADILDGTLPREALEGKLAIVGYTYGAFDKVATPFDQLSDGVELHATLAHNLLHQEVMTPAGRGRTLGAITVIGGILTLLQLRRVRRRTWVPALVAVGVVLGWIVVAYWMFASRRVVVEMIAPLARASPRSRPRGARRRGCGARSRST
jgi:adenylate cyclase